MKPIAKLGYLAAACALLIATFSIIGPRAVRAAVATLIRDQDNAARHPFSGTCNDYLADSDQAGCSVPVPAGEEVVVQSVTFNVTADPSNTTILNYLETTTAGNVILASVTSQDNGMNQPNGTNSVPTLTTTLYADPGTTIGCLSSTKLYNTQVGLTLACNVSGYYVTLP